MDVTNQLPNLFIIGPTKTGTTSLYGYLRQHPDVYFSHVKEVHFFDSNERFNQGPEFYLDYFFRRAYRKPVRVDATPNYFGRSDVVPERIQQFYAASPPLFVITIRDPVKRAWSHYLHTQRIGQETESFEQALKLEEQRLHRDPESWFGYVNEGLYAKHLKVWLRHFPRDRFLFVANEQLRDSPQLVLANILEILGLPNEPAIDTNQVHNAAATSRNVALMRLLVGRSRLKNALKPFFPGGFRRAIKKEAISLNTVTLTDYPQLDPDLAGRLRRQFSADLLELQEMIGLATEQWRKPEL